MAGMAQTMLPDSCAVVSKAASNQPTTHPNHLMSGGFLLSDAQAAAAGADRADGGGGGQDLSGALRG
jgi:hypothetical protein